MVMLRVEVRITVNLICTVRIRVRNGVWLRLR